MSDSLIDQWRAEADEREEQRRGWTGDEQHFGYMEGEVVALRRCANDLEANGGKSIEDVYEDRNLLAAALVQTTHAPSGFVVDPENPEKWAIAFIETPFGQVSWHIPLELAEGLNLPRGSYEWDGHDRERKNDVLATWTKDGCPS